MLLTNGVGFQAEFDLSFADAAAPPSLTGRIFVRGEKILLQSAPAKSKSASAGEFNLMWNETAGQGFFSSESLQGFAPIGRTVHVANLAVQKIASPAPPLDGRPMDIADATATDDSGKSQTFEWMRASDAGDLPTQIRSLNAPRNFTLTLAKIQPGRPPEEMFLPPDGFTKYPSPAALLEELASRQREVLGGGYRHSTETGADSGEGGHRRNRGAQDNPP